MLKSSATCWAITATPQYAHRQQVGQKGVARQQPATGTRAENHCRTATTLR